MNWKLQLAVAALMIMLLGLQYRLWVGEGSLAEVATLRHQLAAQRAELHDLQQRNAMLQAEVDDLKDGLAAIEARARSELGLVRKDETYFQLLTPGSRGDE